MRRFALRHLLAASFLALASPAGPLVAQAVAAAPTPHRHGEAIAEARRMVQGMLDERGLPGVSVAVGVDGRIVWSEASAGRTSRTASPCRLLRGSGSAAFRSR